MTRRIHIKGYKVKNGKVAKDAKFFSVSKQLQIAASKRVRVARKGQTQ